MLLSEPPESAYDLRFNLFGFPIRVTWSFWLAGLIFGYNGALFVDTLFFEASSGVLPWLVMWCAIMFLSILVHELGHAVAFRMCGMQASVVLYHFGGLAVPSSRFVAGGFGAGGGMRRNSQLSSNEQIFISAAGPAAQLLLALIVIVGIRGLGYDLAGGPPDDFRFGGTVESFVPSFLEWVPGIHGGELIRDAGMFATVEFLLFVNIWWAVLNLLPVWPLDGGQITREIVYKFGGGLANAAAISLVTAIVIAVWFYSRGQIFAALLFASLAVTNYQMMNASGNWR